MLGVTLGNLYVDTQGYVPALLENLCDMSCSGTYWLLGGGWLHWEDPEGWGGERGRRGDRDGEYM